MSAMSNLDREVSALDKMGRDDLRASHEEALFEIAALKRELAALKKPVIVETAVVKPYGNSYCILVTKKDVETYGLIHQPVRVEIYGLGGVLNE